MKLIKKKKKKRVCLGGVEGLHRREICRSEKLGSLKSVLKEVKIGLVWTFCQASKHLSAQADSQIINYMTLKYYYFYCRNFSSFVNSKNVSGSSWQKMNVFGYPTQYKLMMWDSFVLDLYIHWSHLSLLCLPLCSCQLLAQMFVCILMGREWRRSTSTLCRTTPSSSWCPEVRPGAEEVKTHPSDQALNVLIFQITPAPF